MKTTRRTPRMLLLPATLLLLALPLAGCSGSSEDAGSSAPASSRDFAAADESAADALDGTLETRALSTKAEVRDRAIISTGNVALRSSDVAQARFDVEKIVDRFRGEVSADRTDTDDDGEVRRSRLVVRIPSESFAEAMSALEDVADLESSDTGNKDVTTQVIDNEVRVRVQRRSIARIVTLLDRAQSISDIVAIESQLSRRQATLGSLEQQQAFLADQTSMSTITVSLERITEAEKAEPDASGFLAGLASGWAGLKSVGVGVATATGALLPFAVVLLLLGLPIWLLATRLRAGRTARTPSTVPAGPGPSTE